MKLSPLSNCPENGAFLLIAQDTPALKELGFKHFIKTKSIDVLPPSMQCHTDLQLVYIGNSLFVSCPECFEYYKKELSQFGARVICGDRRVGGTYPDDAAYNICVVGKTAFCNTKIADRKALSLLSENGIKTIHVNQGYAKCSCAVINENALITADKGIYKTAFALGMNVLLIEPGHVELDGFEYGFFGGCCAKISKNKLFVNGNIKKHPSGHKIRSFLEQQETEIAESGDLTPADIGSLIIA